MCKKILSLLLVSLLVLTMLGGCGSQSKKKEDTKSPETAAKEEEKKDPENPLKVTAEHIGTYGDRVYTNEAGGFLYFKDNKYGVRNFDGSFDSGAVYEDAEVVNGGEANRAFSGYITVDTKAWTSCDDFDTLNSTGLIDVNGKEIIPAKHFLIKSIGGRFVKAITVTAITEDEDRSIAYVTNKIFSLGATEGDTMYTGKWEIYDVTTGKLVPNLTGTSAANFTVYGDVISYVTEGARRYVNAKGEDLPDTLRVFADGSYMPRHENAVYDSSMNKRFDVIPTDFYPVKWENGYYVMSKSVDGSTKSALANEKGEIVSAELDDNGSLSVLKGGLVANDAGIYTLEGRCLLETKYYNHSYYGGYWWIRDADKNVYLIDSDYAVTKVCQLDDNYSWDEYRFAVTQSSKKYYSIAQKQFVDGSVVGLGLVYVHNGDTQDLRNALTDEVLLTGYTNYSVSVDENRVRYVFASKPVDGATVYDFYVLK